jgi:hypothetical protein
MPEMDGAEAVELTSPWISVFIKCRQPVEYEGNNSPTALSQR